MNDPVRTDPRPSRSRRRAVAHAASRATVTLSGPPAARAAAPALLAALAAALPAPAAITWDGGGGNGEFQNPANWNGTDPDADDDGILDDGDLIFAGAVQTSVVVDIDYSGIDSITFAGDADTFTIDGDGAGDPEQLSFNDGASIVNDSTVAGDMTFGGGLELLFTGDATITNNDANGDSAIVIDSNILLGGPSDLLIDGTGDVTINGIITGASSELDFQGTGTLTLNGASNYDGGTSISSGTVLVGDAAAFGTGAVRFLGDATLGATGGAVAGVANAVLVGDGVTLTIGGSEDLELAGSLSGSGSITIDLAGSADALTLSGANGGLLGGITLAEGTLVAGTSTALGAGSLTVTGQDGNAILQAGADDLTLANAIVLDDGAGTAVLDVTGDTGLSLSGAISGDGDLEIGLDAGVFLALGGASGDWTGDTIIDNAGAGLILAGNEALGSGTLRLQADGEVRGSGAGRELSNAVDLGASTLTLGAGDDFTISGVISGSGGVILDAADTRITLSGTNTYTGTTTLTGGTLVLGSDDAIGDGAGGASLAIAGGLLGTGGATVSLDEDITVSGDFGFEDLAGGSLRLTGDVDLGDAARTITSSADEDVILDGTISSTGQDDGLVKAGTGRLILAGDNSAWNGGVTLNAGSLGIGDDGALGGAALALGGDASIFAFDDARTIANDVDLGENTLTITGENDLRLDGDLTQSGGDASVIVNATGTVTFAGAGSDWAGGTTIASGDVVVEDSEALGTGDITFSGGSLAAGVAGVDLDEAIVAADRFTITGSEDLTLSGDVSGAGGITVDLADAADVLTLGGTNSFEGDLVVDRGRVELQNGDALGDGVTASFDGDEAGTLVLSADETIGALSGGDENDGVELGASTLTLAGPAGGGASTFAGVISGTGGLTVTGGTHLLDGASTFTGATTVTGGVLGGTGSLAGDLVIGDGGTLDGGAADAVGTFTVGGGFDLQSGATWVVDISGSDLTSFDVLDVTGSASLASGATIDVDLSQASGTYIVTGTEFQILAADGGITDGGLAVDTDSATLQFYLLESIGVDPEFEDGDTTLSIVANRAEDAFSNPAVVDPGNNRRVGAALDQLIPVADANEGQGEAAELLAQLQVLNGADLNTALSELAPVEAATPGAIAISGVSGYAAVQGGYLASRRDGTAPLFMASGSLSNPSSLVPSVPAGSLASAAAEPWVFGEAIRERDRADAEESLGVDSDLADRYGMNVWAKLYAFESDLDAEGSRPGYRGDFVGGQAGVDWRLGDSVILGLGFGVLDTEADLEPDAGEVDAEGFRLGPYFSWTGTDWFVDGSFSYGLSDYEQDRTVRLPGQPVQTARGDYDGEDLTGYLAVGRAFQFEGGWRLTPAVSLRYSTFDFDGYTETGAGVQNMVVADRSQDSLQSRLSVTLSRRFTGDRLTFVPEVTVGWEHEFEDYDDVEASFGVGGGPFQLDVGGPVENALVLGFGVTVLLDQRLAGFVRYDGLIGDGGDTQGVTFGLNVSF